jgi:hypothetical protein
MQRHTAVTILQHNFERALLTFSVDRIHIFLYTILWKR